MTSTGGILLDVPQSVIGNVIFHNDTSMCALCCIKAFWLVSTHMHRACQLYPESRIITKNLEFDHIVAISVQYVPAKVFFPQGYRHISVYLRIVSLKMTHSPYRLTLLSHFDSSIAYEGNIMGKTAPPIGTSPPA